MVQPHNRRMSISLYIAVLAVADNIVLVRGMVEIFFKYCNKIMVISTAITFAFLAKYNKKCDMPILKLQYQS